MADPTAITMKTVQVSANLLFGKMMDSIAVWVVLAGLAMLSFIAYWYLKVRKQ